MLKLAGEHLRKNVTTWKGSSDMYTAGTVQNPFPQDLDNFGLEMAFLQSRGGCPTGATRALGGVSLGIESGVLMPSTVTPTELTDEDFCIKCGACGEYIWCVVRHGQKCPECLATREC